MIDARHCWRCRSRSCRAGEEPQYGGFALAQVDAAARLDKPDWQILQKLKTDGFGTLLPDIQAIRGLGRALGVRFKAEVATGRIDDGLRTAKTMFAMSRHLGEHPTLIGNLVGIAIASTAIEPLEQMLEHDDCPNLYWALSYLPYPLISIKTGMEGERMSIYWFTQDLSSTAPMSAERITKTIAWVDEMMGDDKDYKASGGLKGYLARRTKDAQKMAAIRKRMVESGLPEARLATFPAEQVILLDEEREMRVRFDEIARLMVFPVWQFDVLNEKVKPVKKEDFLLAYAFLPSSAAVRLAQARLEQRIGLLRTVEALRLYAAGHNATFPTKLSEISVPMPDDPVTGKPFRYEVSGKTAHVRSTQPKGRENDKYFNVHYEITLKN